MNKPNTTPVPVSVIVKNQWEVGKVVKFHKMQMKIIEIGSPFRWKNGKVDKQMVTWIKP